MKWVLIALIWITLSWDAVPGATNYRIQASNDGRRWLGLSYGPKTHTKIPLPDMPGRIDFKLIVIDEGGTERTSAIGWFYDPNMATPYIVNLGGAVTND